MKKTYQNPKMEVVKMETAMVLADSSFSLFKNTNASTKEVGEGDYEYDNAL